MSIWLTSSASKICFFACLVVAAPVHYSLYNTEYIMPSLAAARASNAALKLLSPTSVVVGGTNGIGASMAVKIAQYSETPQVYIVGRSEDAAQQVIERMQSVNPSGQYEFHKCDLTSLSATRELSKSLGTKLPTISHLVLTPGIMTMQGRTETPEGNDVKMMLHYYSRFLIIRNLIPSLSAAPGGARVMSILDSKRGSPKKINWEDLDLKKGYSLGAAADHCMTLNDMMVEKMGKDQPSITTIHGYPSFVATDLGKNLGLPSVLNGPLKLFTKTFGTSPDDCAEWLFYALNAPSTSNARFVDNRGEDIKGKTPATPEQLEAAWKHSEALVDKV